MVIIWYFITGLAQLFYIYISEPLFCQEIRIAICYIYSYGIESAYGWERECPVQSQVDDFRGLNIGSDTIFLCSGTSGGCQMGRD